MSYLVTGAAGFIGARFVESCNRRGLAVFSVDEPEFFENASRPEHAGIDFGTVIPREELVDWLRQGGTQLDAVIHMGACSDTTETRWDYLEKNNIEYSKDLWSYCVEKQIPFIHASSAATYGDGSGSNGYDDDEKLIPALQPLNLYGKSKQLFDLWMLEQEKAGKTPPAWSAWKFFNVYGHGERHKGKMASVVLHAFDQIQKDGKVRLFKSHKPGIRDGFQQRDFVFVDDVVDVLNFAIEKPIRRGIFNLGSGKARPFVHLVSAVYAALGRQENIEFIPTPVEIRDKYQYFTQAKMEKLRKEGYTKPFTTLEEGVKSYISRLVRG